MDSGINRGSALVKILHTSIGLRATFRGSFFVVGTSQILFSIALGVITVVVIGFAAFVISTTMWGNRWVRRSK